MKNRQNNQDNAELLRFCTLVGTEVNGIEEVGNAFLIIIGLILKIPTENFHGFKNWLSYNWNWSNSSLSSCICIVVDLSYNCKDVMSYDNSSRNDMSTGIG